LEPCSHFGKTPPCADALVAAGIKKVFIGATDPNPLVLGNGIARLKNQNVEVVTGLLDTQSIALNFGFYKRMQTGMPWVRLEIAASLDGYTALSNGKSQWITGPAARLDGHRWRAQASVILTGIGTILADDPQLNVREVDTPRQPLKAIIDAELETPPTAKIFKDGQVIIFSALHDKEEMNNLYEAHPHLKIIPLPNSTGKVDLAAAFKYLADQYHANEVHVEAGSRLNGSLIIREGLCRWRSPDSSSSYSFGVCVAGMANIPPVLKS
jgi:diaminohydroxyphosphoribosylaminopyrimidine deaminase/5-amino-6-(5-phosphoribosylamino)uracil reductase